MHAFQATHNAVPKKQVEVTALSLLFAAKLKMRGKAAKQSDVVLTTGEENAAKKAPPSGEVSWTTKRKEAYLKRYGRQRLEETTAPDVGMSAVAFAARLKSKRASSAAAATGAEPEVVSVS